MKLSDNFKNTLLIIVAVLGVGLMILFFYEKSLEERSNQENTKNQENDKVDLNLAHPSGNTDSVFNNSFVEMDLEIELESDNDNLADSIFSDNNEVSAFSNVYDEVEF